MRKKMVLLAIPVLLLVWLLILRMGASRQGSGAAVTAMPLKSARSEALPSSEGPSIQKGTAAALSVKDPFQIAEKARRVLLQREEEKRKEQERKEAAARAAEEASRAAAGSPASSMALPQLTLQGFLLGDIPRAIINRKVVKVGDTIEGAQVIHIAKDGVRVRFQGQEFPVSPASPSERKSSRGSAATGGPPRDGGPEYGPGRWEGR